MHALLGHLEAKGFPGSPRPRGFDEAGREVLTYLPGETVGSRKPWPAWVHAGATLDQVARWLRAYHDAVASPTTPEWELAFTAFSWVPLHARHVVTAEGFTDFAARPRRLRRFLDSYGYTGTIPALLDTMQSVLRAHEHGIRHLADTGDPRFAQLLQQCVVDNLHRAAAELREFAG